ncbi:MAG: pentapeptide repeat-containing protein [Planctomycetes bacterium]|nr:pentapeptide repeat-containing protein [Planctomycetota bacterium]
MAKKASEKQILRDRWSSLDFKKAIEPRIEAFVAINRFEGPIDFRGGVFGAGAVSLSILQSVSFIDAKVSNIEFGYSKFDCGFIDASISNCDFSECSFDDCSMRKAKFSKCSFRKSKMIALLNDAVFEECDFTDAIIKGNISKAHGGRRVVFVKCNFKDAQFKGIELRASRFVDCNFDGVHFFGCTISSPKFEGGAPTESQFTDVDFVGLLTSK